MTLVMGLAILTITTGNGSFGKVSGGGSRSTVVYISPKIRPKCTNNTKLAGANRGDLSGAKGRLVKNDIADYLLKLGEIKTKGLSLIIKLLKDS